MNACTVCEEQLTEWLWDSLGPEQRQPFEAHLAASPSCARTARSLREAQRATALHSDEEPSAALLAGLKAEARKAVAEQRADRGAEERRSRLERRAASESAASPFPWLRGTGPMHLPLWLPIAASVVCAVAIAFVLFRSGAGHPDSQTVAQVRAPQRGAAPQSAPQSAPAPDRLEEREASAKDAQENTFAKGDALPKAATEAMKLEPPAPALTAAGAEANASASADADAAPDTGEYAPQKPAEAGRAAPRSPAAQAAPDPSAFDEPRRDGSTAEGSASGLPSMESKQTDDGSAAPAVASAPVGGSTAKRARKEADSRSAAAHLPVLDALARGMPGETVAAYEVWARGPALQDEARELIRAAVTHLAGGRQRSSAAGRALLERLAASLDPAISAAAREALQAAAAGGARDSE